ncbi:MAG TPA: NYN domain-containing protein [Gemmataceae bacterium]|nr:NYN domain-containing protein [Gemmataceae bacterium]
MRYLIDGYNLIYAMGMLRKRAGPTGLLKARRGLLGLLRGAYGEDASQVTVVFDARGAPAGAVEEEDYEGIHVRYAVHQEQADDLIESLIQHHSAPRQLTVVSDDHRLQQAARRRQCMAVGCGDYIDWLARHRQERKRRSPEGETKPEHVSEHETERWLQEFRDLADDPALKEVFDPFDFEQGEDRPRQ